MDTVAERDSLREDLREVRGAKRAGDQSFRDQAERLHALEREVTFYRQQAAAAISQRDSTAWECEQLRQAAVEAEARARDAEGKAETAEVERAVADRRATEATARVEDLSAAAAEAAAIPGLKSDLEKAKGREKALTKRIEGLQAEGKAAQEAAAQAATTVEESASRIKLLQSEAAAAREELGEVAQQKVEALVRLSEAEAARGRADAEVRRLREELAAAKEQLGQAAQEKVAALMQVAELRAEADGAESDAGSLRSGSARPTPKSSPMKATPESRWRWLGGGGSGRSASPVRSPVRSP